MKIIWKRLIKKIIEFKSSKQRGQNQIQLMAKENMFEINL
jgi:hypothetical protein